jgi:transcriptional regulator with XRE-family HTH domain
VAERVRARRLELDLTQAGLARRAGLAPATYRRFEQTGAISLRGLAQLAVVLRATADFGHLFARPAYASIDDVIQARAPRRRGHRD